MRAQRAIGAIPWLIAAASIYTSSAHAAEWGPKPCTGVEAAVFLNALRTGGGRQTFRGQITELNPTRVTLSTPGNSTTFFRDEIRTLELLRLPDSACVAFGKRYWGVEGRQSSSSSDRAALKSFVDLVPRDTIFVIEGKDFPARAHIGEIVVLTRTELIFRENGVDRLFEPTSISRVGLDSLTLAAGYTARMSQGKHWGELVERWWSGMPVIAQLLQNMPVVGPWFTSTFTHVSFPVAQLLSVIAFAVLVLAGAAVAHDSYVVFQYRRALELVKLFDEAKAGLRPSTPAGLESTSPTQQRGPAVAGPPLPPPPSTLASRLRNWGRTAPTRASMRSWRRVLPPDQPSWFISRVLVPLAILLCVVVGCLLIAFAVWVYGWLAVYAPADDLLEQPVETLLLLIYLLPISVWGVKSLRQGILGTRMWLRRVWRSRKQASPQPEVLVAAYHSWLRLRAKRVETLRYELTVQKGESTIELEIPAGVSLPAFIVEKATISVLFRTARGQLRFRRAQVVSSNSTPGLPSIVKLTASS